MSSDMSSSTDASIQESKTSAATQVLHLYELLEDILLYLPLPDILLAQRVCKRWRDIIIDSDNINRVLFRKPLDDRVITLTNPIFLPPRVPGRGSGPVRSHWRTREPECKSIKPVLNPFLHSDLRTDSIQDLIERVGITHQIYPSKHRSMGKGGSWEQMLLLQPVPAALSYQCQVYQLLGDGNKHISAAAENAFRLGGILEDIKGHMKHCHSCRRLWDLSGREWFRGTMLATTVLLTVSGWEMLAILHTAKEPIDL